MKIDRIITEVLRTTRVVDSRLQEAVELAGREYWPELDEGGIQVADFKKGVLHVLVDSHVRLCEARGFAAEAFRARVNEHLASGAEQTSGYARGAGEAGATRPGAYVSRVVFHVKGTY